MNKPLCKNLQNMDRNYLKCLVNVRAAFSLSVRNNSAFKDMLSHTFLLETTVFETLYYISSVLLDVKFGRLFPLYIQIFFP